MRRFFFEYLKAFVIVFIILSPLLLLGTKHYWYALVLTPLLYVACNAGKWIFYLLSFYYIFIDLVLLHLWHHWGVRDIRSRIDIVRISPQQESLEYLRSYITFFDLALVLIGIAVLVALYFFLKRSPGKKCKFKEWLLLVVVLAVLQNLYPLKYLKLYFKAQKRVELVKKREKFLQNNTLKLHDPKPLYDFVVVCIGESAQRGHHQLYGYPRATNPKLSQLKDIVKVKAIAPANQTEFAVSALLTDATSSNWAEGYISFSLLDYFKEAGYSTAWISNQGYAGKHDTYITALAKSCDVKKFFNFDYFKGQSDDIFIDYLKQKDFGQKRWLYILHLVGSHFKYSERYPEDFAYFRGGAYIVDTYDNSIRFTDFVLYSIYTVFKATKKPFLLVYLSDHGEVVSKDRYGHGFMPPFKEEFEVPFLLYSSIQTPQLQQFKKIVAKRVVNTQSLKDILLYLNGIVDELNISTSTKVFALDPKNLFDYTTLQK